MFEQDRNTARLSTMTPEAEPKGGFYLMVVQLRELISTVYLLIITACYHNQHKPQSTPTAFENREAVACVE